MNKKEKILILEKEIDSLHEILEEKNKDWDYEQSYEAYTLFISPETKKLNILDRNLRLIQDFEMGVFDDFGDKMTIKEFKQNCECGGFIDYDGHGYYASESQLSNILIYPSDVENNSIRSDFSHIVWYNK